MDGVIEKVTLFVTRQGADGRELLLFEHPHAGIQIPAGTVEEGETPEQAALREAAEETGMPALFIPRSLGSVENLLAGGHRVTLKRTPVYARPDPASFHWADLPRGIAVAVLRHSGGFSQVCYEESDNLLAPQYVTLSITGWVPDEALAHRVRRHFFELGVDGLVEERWVVATDNHHFTLFWAPLSALPEIVSPQHEWLKHLVSDKG